MKHCVLIVTSQEAIKNGILVALDSDDAHKDFLRDPLQPLRSLQAKAHGVLDFLKANIHTREIPVAAGKATGNLSGIAAEVEVM